VNLMAYVKEHHTTGCTWNPKGGDIAANSPPPAPSAAAAKPKAAPAKAKGGAAGGLMGELGGRTTADGLSAATGLKKVGSDQQTWKAEYKGDKPVPKAKPKFAPKQAAAPTKPASHTFDDRGNKWVIEFQTKDSNPNGVCTVEITDSKQQVYIYGCVGATIDIKGKTKGIAIDGCTKTNVLFDTAISSCELVNCKQMKIQTRGTCPSVAIDKTDGCVVYLSKEACDGTTFVTSKSSEMNVSWPDASGDMLETPIPEQFQHKLDTKKKYVSSGVSDLYSH
jgi:adenylyl cyclase-associated protein